MLAHSLLSRNKSDCQTDYKLRNFGNRNYLHAITKVQLNSVGVKISKMKKSKFEKKLTLGKETISKLNDEEMDQVKGGDFSFLCTLRLTVVCLTVLNCKYTEAADCNKTETVIS